MKSDRSVSIVIPVRNRSGLISRCLDSVYAQTRRPAKVIVVDNASTDDTVQTIEDWMASHKDLAVVILSESTPGASAARNKGLEAVETEFVFFFDSDDEMKPRLLERALDTIGDNDIVHWKGEVKGLDGKSYVKSYYTDSYLRRQFYNSVLSTQLVMARTSLFRSIGGWNEAASVWNDWEIGIRLLMTSPRITALPETLVLIHAQAASITGKAFKERIGEWENTLRIVEQAVEESNRSVTEKKKMLDMVAYRRVVLAAHYNREGAFEAAGNLLTQTLKTTRLSPTDKLLLRLIYKYTSLGGRAAYYLWR